MTKILEQTSRVLAIMGIALIVWAGMGAQTAKAIDLGWTYNWAICAVTEPAVEGDPSTCTARAGMGACDVGCCQNQNGPITKPNGNQACCYKVNPAPAPC